jgi:hypothetical protein
MSNLHKALAVVLLYSATFESHAAPAQECKTVSIGSSPVLRWCETATNYTYEILTHKVTKTFDRTEMQTKIIRLGNGFIRQECKVHGISFERAQAELWLSVPASGMELALPRIALRLLAEDGSERNLVFSNRWDESWRMDDSNLHYLGAKRYDSTINQSESGVVPTEIIFRSKSARNGKPDQETLDLLSSFDVKVGAQLSPTKPRFIGYTPRFKEEETAEKIAADPNSTSLLEWILVNNRMEALGDRVKLIELEMPHWSAGCSSVF